MNWQAPCASSVGWCAPGRLVSIKGADVGLWLFSPGDPAMMWRVWEAGDRVSAHIHGILRSRTMRRWLERAGLVDVWQRATLNEMWAPLEPIQRTYIASQFQDRKSTR